MRKFEIFHKIRQKIPRMDRVRLRKVFGRFRKDELPEVMGLLDLGEGRKAASKQELVTSLVDKCMVSMLLTQDS